MKITNREMLTAFSENYLYGLLGWSIPISIVIGDIRVISIVAFLFYMFLSKIINRDKYVTNLGKYFMFPIPAMLGAISAYYLGEIIKTIL